MSLLPGISSSFPPCPPRAKAGADAPAFANSDFVCSRPCMPCCCWPVLFLDLEISWILGSRPVACQVCSLSVALGSLAHPAINCQSCMRKVKVTCANYYQRPRLPPATTPPPRYVPRRPQVLGPHQASRPYPQPDGRTGARLLGPGCRTWLSAWNLWVRAAASGSRRVLEEPLYEL